MMNRRKNQFFSKILEKSRKIVTNKSANTMQRNANRYFNVNLEGARKGILQTLLLEIKYRFTFFIVDQFIYNY